MNTSPTPRPLFVWLFAALLGVALTVAPASASVTDQSTASALSVAVDEPEPTALDSEASPGISVFSISQCPSGSFCVWSGIGYTGQMLPFTTQSQYTSVPWNSIKSFYNNRSSRVFIYGNASGTPSACFGARAKRNTVSGFLREPSGVYLSTATSC